MNRIYLDHNATSVLWPEALDAMMPALTDNFANPSSPHLSGEAVQHEVDLARSKMAELLGIRASELTMTSGGTESINWAILGVVAARPNCKRLITSGVEHAATLAVCAELQRRDPDFEIVTIGVDEFGRPDHDELAQALEENPAGTALVSLIWGNNETGSLADIASLAALARQHRVPIHVDGVQIIGKVPVDLKALGIDLLSFSAHKFGGPKGVGGLFHRRALGLRPLVHGGGQEVGRRGGTLNVAGILGQAKALEVSLREWESKRSEVEALRDQLAAGILEAFPEAKAMTPREHRVANTINIAFPGIESHAIVLTLAKKGLDCSSASACSSHENGPSHVLAAMNVPVNYIHGALRFSLATTTSPQDIERAISLVIDAVHDVSRI